METTAIRPPATAGPSDIKPLPGSVVLPQPERQWKDRRLAEVYYYTRPPSRPKVAIATGTQLPGGVGQAFTWMGRNFTDAVAQASQRSRDNNGVMQALLQARDGSYYTTSLSHPLKERSGEVAREYEAFDGPHMTKWDVAPHPTTSEVKAFVGTAGMYDLRNGERARPMQRQPLPSVQPSQMPALDGSLARVQYIDARFGNPANMHVGAIDPPQPSEKLVWGGRDYQDAVAAAAARSGDHAGVAQAVIQAADGAFWLADTGSSFRMPLVDIRRKLHLDPDWMAQNDIANVRAWRSDPRLRALVGEAAWIEFDAGRATATAGRKNG